jgi:RimJ/RimL family protein N-acetyltransferase
MIATRLIRNDEAAFILAKARGMVVPPIFEEVRTEAGTEFRRMAMGWIIASRDGGPRGFVILFASPDGEDWEVMAHGGWSVWAARDLFRFVFDQGQTRVSARCKAANARAIQVFQRFGFRIEGRKRLPDGDVINLGMLREECRLLGRA